ncbi:MAG TPA: TIGR04282 family arsenosugar biosynthesis glycosyltransferase [Gammaproteobacteria bacterium]|nr:TIGR04282 family arsenosugar biosynthesis glycosyltransferase [Gammaproteobacteria bacterium]
MIPVGVFAKPPLPGLVKTRLVAEIGADKATRVYRYCLEYTLDLARHSGLDYQLYLSRECEEPLFQDEQYRLQRGGDLGARMINALRDMIDADTRAAIIVGSDCLDLGAAHLQQAAQALSSHELVLAPAADGGFALIGCREANPDLFKSVAWSSDRVLEQTLANARTLGYRVCLLETVRDIDRLRDLEHYPELFALVASS